MGRFNALLELVGESDRFLHAAKCHWIVIQRYQPVRSKKRFLDFDLHDAVLLGQSSTTEDNLNAQQRCACVAPHILPLPIGQFDDSRRQA